MNKGYLKDKVISFFKKIINYFLLISKGEANFNIMLYLWGVLPGIIIAFFLQPSINSIKNKFIAIILLLIILVYFVWHLFSIKKTLKVHPEYRVVKPTKKELYAGKTKEEIENIKKEQRKENVQKLLLLRGWDSKPAYILIGFFDAYVILTQIQSLLNILEY